MAPNSPTDNGGDGDPLYEAACTLYYLANKKLVDKKLNRRTDRERNQVTAAGDNENTTTAPQPPPQCNKPRSSPPSQPPNKLAENTKPSSPPSQPPNNKPTQNNKPRSTPPNKPLIIAPPPAQPPKKRTRSTPSPPSKPKRARVAPLRPNGNNNQQRPPPPPPPQEGGVFPPEWLRSVLGRCCEVPLYKSLHNSDVRDNQNRLCMTKAHVRTYFMPLLKAEEKPEEGVPITVYNWEGKPYKMKFRIWGDEKNHVFIGEWKNFCHDHFFETGNLVAVWMFRHLKTDLLCALVTRLTENNLD